ncbi:MAG: hypothetical protein KDB27_19530 [Planctomycetales bacterium]|nr:hypothetical protein [Planctomycetales bacterium]
MKTIAQGIAAQIVLASSFLIPVQGVNAADPVAVVSVSGIKEALSDVEYLLEATGTDAFGQFFMPSVKNYLQGLNTERPLGMALSFNGTDFQPLVFLPVDDLDTFLTQVEDTVGEPADAGDGILELQGPETVFVKQKDGWAFVAQHIEALDDLPEQPEKLLGGLYKEYDVAIRGFIGNIPEQYREMIIGQMEAGMEQGLADNDDPNAEKLARAQVDEIKRLFNEADTLTFGWNVDTKNKQIYFEGSATAKPGSKLARDMAATANAQTKYSGFIVPNAAISGNLAGVITEDKATQTKAMLSTFEKSAVEELEKDGDIDSDEMRASAKNLVSSVFKILRDTADTGKFDSATSVILEGSSITIASASHVADGSEAEKLVQDLVKAAEKSGDVSFSKLKFNAGTHNGVRLHEIAIPIPDEEYVSTVLGGELEVCIGADQNDLYVVVGANPVSTLKSMIDSSKAKGAIKASPFNATVKLSPILRFAESVEGKIQVGEIAEMLEDSGNDHVRIEAVYKPNQAAYRFTIEEGVLRAIGQVIQAQMAQNF